MKNSIELVKKIQSIAFAGLEYCENDFDRERYEDLKNLSLLLLAEISGTPLEKIQNLFVGEVGYQTPKVDVRAVVFKENKILMVKEKIDGRWSIPGGWADIGFSPSEIASKEAKEEAGADVKPVRLLAIVDKLKHDYPISPFHIYKIFIHCELLKDTIASGTETSDVNFFSREKLPPLSETRITAEQISMLFHLWENPEEQVVFD
ncbi:MAG: NUDIX hydrolase N-terminal domain-containing protein [Ignavibacteriaceae bacterium]|jgi:ADP-ribose pyrophosphatase YjhB (NUDIX family)